MNAFVIMPFASEFTPIYDQLIKPALEEAGYDVARADSFIDQQNILRDIIVGLAQADLVIADLTTLNANVFYELGLCHGLGIPTIMLAQSMEDVPFDLRSYKVQVYSTQFNEVQKLQQSLKDVSEKHKGGKVNFGNPIKDFHPKWSEKSDKVDSYVNEDNRDPISNDLKTTTNEVIKDNNADDNLAIPEDEEDNEKGILDFLVQSAKAGEDIDQIFGDLAREILLLGDRISAHAEKMTALTENPNLGTATQLHRTAMMAAANMNTFSNYAEEKIPLAVEAIDLLIESNFEFANFLNPNDISQAQSFSNFKETIEGLLISSREGLSGMFEFREIVAGLIGLSKEINVASRRQVKVLSEIIGAMEKVEAFCIRALAVLDEKVSGRIFESES